MKKLGIIEKYIFLTNLTILLLILLVPVGSYLLTGQKVFLSPVHFLLSLGIGVFQIFLVNRLFKREIKNFWESFEKAIATILDKVKSVKKKKELDELRAEKDNFLKPLREDKGFSTLIEHIDTLLNEFFDTVELSLVKDDLVRKLTTTLNTQLLSQILANNLIKIFDVDAVAVYLKDLRGNDFVLKLNKGFSSVKSYIDQPYIEKLVAKDNLIAVEDFTLSLDRGICDIPAQKVFVVKLSPRKDKIVGLLFLGLEGEKPQEKLLIPFLQEMGTTISLIFENSLEHERSVLLASYDPLTKAYNRQEGIKLIRNVLKKAEFEKRNVCLLLLDIDHFKRINDTYGHDIGDIVLKEVVSVVRRSIRDKDIVVRWGGEEFLIAIENVPPEKASEIAERIRKNMENYEITITDNLKLKVTVSIGVACSEIEGTYYFEELFNIADKRLYRAKNSGRNTVVFS